MNSSEYRYNIWNDKTCFTKTSNRKYNKKHIEGLCSATSNRKHPQPSWQKEDDSSYRETIRMALYNALKKQNGHVGEKQKYNPGRWNQRTFPTRKLWNTYLVDTGSLTEKFKLLDLWCGSYEDIGGNYTCIKWKSNTGCWCWWYSSLKVHEFGK